MKIRDDKNGTTMNNNTGTTSTTMMRTPLVKPLHMMSSPSTGSLSCDVSPDTTLADTPVAVEPVSPCLDSPSCTGKDHNIHKHTTTDTHDLSDKNACYKVILDGIPADTNGPKQQQQLHQHNNINLPPPPDGFDDASLESLLSSLGEEDEQLCDWSLDPILHSDSHDNTGNHTKEIEEDDEDDSNVMFFTPLEQRPSTRMERLERELQLRSELLVYLQVGLPPAYQGRLQQQEAVVQQWTLECAQRKQHTRQMRKQARRQRRKRQELLLEYEQQDGKNRNHHQEDSREDEVKPKYLFEKEEEDPNLLLQLLDEHHDHPQPSNSQRASTTTTAASESTATTSFLRSLFSYWEFEWYHGVPAILSLLLVCVAEAAVYEFIMGVVLVALQPFVQYRILTDREDRILEFPAHFRRVEDICYGMVLLVGLVMARVSGLLYSVCKKQRKIQQHHHDHKYKDIGINSRDKDNGCDDQKLQQEEEVVVVVSEAQRRQQVMLHPHRIDRPWSTWLYSTKKGRLVKGCLDVIAFYLCFVSVMYFLGRFALCMDQRAPILHDMPSNQNPRQHHHHPQLQVPPVGLVSTLHDNDTHTSNVSNKEQQQEYDRAERIHDQRVCPVDPDDILLPYMKAGLPIGSSMSSDSSSDSDSDDDDDKTDIIANNNKNQEIEFVLSECDDDDHEDEDDFGNPIIYAGGSEDEEYLYHHLSASAYHQFWGYGYRAALFDLPHQLLFNFCCSVVAMYALKRYFGCSIWEDW